MTSIGKLQEFDESSEDWNVYVERIKLFLSCNHVKLGDKVPTVLTLIGSKTYSILRDLLTPELPETKKLEEIFDVLNAHYSPKPFVQSERFRFQNRLQLQDEKLNDFVLGLKRLTKHCQFGTTLDERLRDQFVFGLHNDRIQQKILLSNNLKFNEAVVLALSYEMAEKDTKEIKLASSRDFTEEVHKLASTRPSSFKIQEMRNRSMPNCNRCGRNTHSSNVCRFVNAKCFLCGKMGHIRRACKSESADFRQESSPQRFMADRSANEIREVNVIAPDTNVSFAGRTNPCYKKGKQNRGVGETVDAFVHLAINDVRGQMNKPLVIRLQVNGQWANMEFDTGAAVSIMPIALFRNLFKGLRLTPTEIRLSTYSKQKLDILGKVFTTVCFNGKTFHDMELFVVREGGRALLGRTWIMAMKLLDNLALFSTECHAVNQSVKQGFQKVDWTRLKVLLDKHKEVFDERLGEIKNMEARLTLREGSVPKFFKPRPVPFALKPAIEKELEKLQAQGILTPITQAEWAAPIVPIVKQDKALRICGDYKVGLNPCLRIDYYPLPKIEEMFSQIKNGAFFTKLDLAQAYQQMKLHEDSIKLININTHMGLFQVNRLPFGVASSPAIFQKTMDQILEGLPGVMCYLDDILCSGKDLEEHFRNLDLLLRRLSEAGIHLKRSKCEFFKERIEYLGHVIDREGLHPGVNKLKNAYEAPPPTNVPQLRSFLGLISYYRKFLPDLATKLAPMYKLLEKGQKWKWDTRLQKIFEEVKALVLSPAVLMRFEPELPVSLATDASAYGLGAVISHILPDGSDRPIAFASRSLSKAEIKYAQIDKEALGIIFGLKKFHQYLYGRKFKLITDHKPLTKIFGPESAIPTLAAARLQRWALVLAAYDYDIVFRNSKEHANADVWSRLPCKESEKSDIEEVPCDICLIETVEDFPVNFVDIARETAKDPILSKVFRFTSLGWPSDSTKELSEYYKRKEEISIQQGCLLWGIRVIIPKKLQGKVLKELHSGHIGMLKMKMLARSFFWWSGLDEDINHAAKACNQCSLLSNNPAKAPLHPWSWPTKPWQRIHIDFAGPFRGVTFLVAVDAHSKWPEVQIMRSTTASKTIDVLNSWIARFGIPEHIVSDNGSQFTSAEFSRFCRSLGIRHTRSAPYHPSTNGQAERFVQILKRFLKKKTTDAAMIDCLHQLLLSYRSTPHVTTRETPAFLFLKRQLRTVLDLLRPSTEDEVHRAQDNQCHNHQNSQKERDFGIGQAVLARAYQSSEKWQPATITEQTGPVSFVVQLMNGQLWKRHKDQLLPGVRSS